MPEEKFLKNKRKKIMLKTLRITKPPKKYAGGLLLGLLLKDVIGWEELFMLLHKLVTKPEANYKEP